VRGAGQLKYERWLERWADLFALQKGRALVLGGSSGLEASLLLGLGFQVTAVDFSAALIAESLQRNPLADHQVADIRSLSTALTGRFSIVVTNLSLQPFERKQTELLIGTAVGVLAERGIFVLKIEGVESREGVRLESSRKTPSAADDVAKLYDLKALIALLERDLDVVAVDRRSADRFGGPGVSIEAIGIWAPQDLRDAWPIPHATNGK
jgi:SAM-dependent methyltransferase